MFHFKLLVFVSCTIVTDIILSVVWLWLSLINKKMIKRCGWFICQFKSVFIHIIHLHLYVRIIHSSSSCRSYYYHSLTHLLTTLLYINSCIMRLRSMECRWMAGQHNTGGFRLVPSQECNWFSRRRQMPPWQPLPEKAWGRLKAGVMSKLILVSHRHIAWPFIQVLPYTKYCLSMFLDKQTFILEYVHIWSPNAPWRVWVSTGFTGWLGYAIFIPFSCSCLWYNQVHSPST